MEFGPTFMLIGTVFTCVYLSIIEGLLIYYQNLLERSFLLFFLVEVAQFSMVAHGKPDLQAFAVVKSESLNFLCTDNEDPLQ